MLRAALLFLFLLTFNPLFAQERVPSFGEPAISPDGSEIAFISQGDIWSVPRSGGDARLFVSGAAYDTHPLYSPDGKWLAFLSYRTGNGDIYVLDLSAGSLKRVTYDDGVDQLSGWSRDSQWIYFHNAALDISAMNDIFRVRVTGGTPMQVSAERYVNEFFAAPSPDGMQLALCAHGIASSQWWRKGHSHLDESEIWLMKGTGDYQRITDYGAKDLWPMWSADGRQLFFISDRSGAENLWSVTPGTAASKLTAFTDGRALWPNISADGKTIVFERNFAIWIYDVATGKAEPLSIRLRGAPPATSVEHKKLTDGVEDFALSPDGKKIAFINRGEVFAVSAKDGGDATRLTTTAGRESQPAWLPDNHRVIYVSDREGPSHIYLYDFSNDSEKALTSGSSSEGSPRVSPDGKMIVFQRDRKQIVLLDLESKKERVLATANLFEQPLGAERPLEWSPDSKWIAFLSAGNRLFTNVTVVPSAGGEARPISVLANGSSNTVSWSPDGRFVLMDTSQRTENGQIARIDLVLQTPKFREDQFRELFENEKPQTPPEPEDKTKKTADKKAGAEEPQKTPPKVEINFDNIYQRTKLLPVGVDVLSQTISPDGKWVAMLATAANQQNIYVYSLDELSKEPPVAKQLSSTAGEKRVLQFTPDSKEIYYLEDGSLNIVKLEDQKSRGLAVTAEMDVDFERERNEAFDQGWRWLNENFYDEKMNGVDWAAERDQYGPRVKSAANPFEMRRIMSLMIGDLNSSHSGMYPPRSVSEDSTGYLGARFDRAEYENSGKLKITEVLPLSPAQVYGLKAGEYIQSVDGQNIDAHTDLYDLLKYKINKRVTLTITSNAKGDGSRKVALKPVNYSTSKGITYRAWVNANRDYVGKISNGKLGYIHMYDMSYESLQQLFVDLDAENHARKGVVIDIRNNNGGFVNAYALDVLTRRGYLNMTFRGFPTAPARSILGQRSLELPTILITNQHSLSDAEDFTEGYRGLKLGKVVGEPTAGWIIYTSNVELIDGSAIRLPFIRITAADGSDMEMHPRPVDVAVSRQLGESASGKDSQLDNAVSELLKQIEH